MMHVGGYHEYIGGYHEYIGGYHEYVGGYHEYIGGYHEYIGGGGGGGNIMMHVGEQVDKSLSISIENPDVLNISRCIHDIPRCTEYSPMYS